MRARERGKEGSELLPIATFQTIERSRNKKKSDNLPVHKPTSNTREKLFKTKRNEGI